MERYASFMIAYLIIVVPTGRPVVGIGVLLSVVLLLVAVLLAPVAPVAVLAGGGGRGGVGGCGGGVAGAVVVGVVGVGVEVARVRGRRQAQGGCNGVTV